LKYFFGFLDWAGSDLSGSVNSGDGATKKKKKRKRKEGGQTCGGFEAVLLAIADRRTAGRWSTFLRLLCVFSSAMFSISIFFCISSSPRFYLLLLLSSSICNGGYCCWRSDDGA
jgi:hypothetical protein